VRDNGSKPTWLVLLFTMSMLVASACAREDWGGTIPLGCGMMAIFATTGLLVLPRSEPPGTFQCPFVPIFPLLGIAANCYMMGALPAQSWLFTFLWVMIGVALYFSYGMEHSVLGQEEEKRLNPEQRMAEDEMTPLNHQKRTNSYNAMTLLPPSSVTAASSEFQ
jgi:basic amino acid/polyamine antiporter, APA family